jgi:xanthine/uracil permease
VLELLAIAGVYALMIGYLLFRYALYPPHEGTDFDPGTALSFLFVIAFILFVVIVISRYAKVPWQRIGLVTGLVIAAVAIIFSGHDYVMAILVSAVILLTARFISIRYLQKYG